MTRPITPDDPEWNMPDVVLPDRAESLRDQDPAVWAAAFAAEYRAQAEAIRAATDIEMSEHAPRAGINMDRCVTLANAAVRALHPASEPPPMLAPGEIRLIDGVIHAARLPDETDAAFVARVRAEAQRRTGDHLRVAARAVCDHACARPTRDPLSVPAHLIAALHEAIGGPPLMRVDRLAVLEAAERAYLLAAGTWQEDHHGRWRRPGYPDVLTQIEAVAVQRCEDEHMPSPL